jgi:type I restriction enzyme S subunit
MTSMWKECKLGDVVNLKRGYDLPRSKRQEGNVPVVSSSGITGHHNEAKVKAPGVVTGRYGTLGEIHYIEKDFWPLNTTLYVQDFKGNDPRYVSYLLLTLNFAVQNVAAAVPGVNRNFLHQLSVRVPPPPTQRKIAAILSAYDDLIENNARRIAILEETARLLYREWFVHFRFPGHEQVAMVDSELGPIPEGWEVAKVKPIVKRLKAGKTYKKTDVSETGRVPVIDQSRELVLGFHNNEPDHQATSESPIIIFGDHTCKMQLVVEPFSVGPNVVPFVSKVNIPITYLYFLVNNLVETREYKRHWTELMNKQIVLAPNTHAEQFAAFAKPIFAQIDSVTRRNMVLRRTRDLLLPSLISGEVDVSDLNL